MSTLAKTSAPSPSEPAAPPLLAARWVRVAVGLSLLGLSIVLAAAALRMPFLVISTAAKTHTVGGAAQSENLHLILAATGIIGAVLALIYAVSTVGLKATFFVVGGIATGFSAMLMFGAWQHVKRGTVSDPIIYSEIKQVEAVMQIGSGLWACLVAGLGILLLSVLVLLAGRAAATAEEPPPPARKRVF